MFTTPSITPAAMRLRSSGQEVEPRLRTQASAGHHDLARSRLHRRGDRKLAAPALDEGLDAGLARIRVRDQPKAAARFQRDRRARGDRGALGIEEPAQELERVLKGLQAQQVAYEKRIEDAHDARNRAVQERDNARRVLETMPASKTIDEVRRLANQQARLDAANTTLDALRAELSALTTMRGLLPLSMEAWRMRYTALSDSDPEARQQAERSLAALLSRVDALKSYATDLNTLTAAALRSQQSRVSTLDENAPGRRYEQAALDAAERAAAAVGEVEAVAQRLVVAQTRWKREYADASKQRSSSERAAEYWAGTKDIARTLWNFELFAVEDTVDIGGKPVTLARGVTVGKSIGALLIFVIGYQLGGFMATRAQRVMVERFAVDMAQARVLRRWIMLLTGFVLLVITLNLAHTVGATQ